MRFSILLISIVFISFFITSCSSEEPGDFGVVIDLVKNPINIPFEGEESLEVEIKTNVENLQIEIDNDALSWVTLTEPIARNTRTDIIYLKINENQSTNGRETKIKIQNRNNINDKIIELTIIQEGREYGIYTAKDLITLGVELSKNKELRDSSILSKYGIFNKESNKWNFTQRRDINLNPNLNFHIDNSNSNDFKITYTGDIDNKWVPIGYSAENGVNEVEFEDVYDGGGFKIKNLFIEGEYAYAGLFGKSKDAQFKNIVLESGINISHFKKFYSYAGALVAYSANSTLENVHSSMLINNQHNVTGGIIGWGMDTEINECSFKNSYILLKSLREEGHYTTEIICGGIIGRSGDVAINNCEVDDVSIQFLGGILGGISGCTEYNYNKGYVEISNCNSNISVYAQKDRSEVIFGGIIGDAGTCKIIKSNTSGELVFEGDRYFPAYGGVVGRVSKYSVIAGCKNQISIVNSEESKFSSGNIGGILGDVGSSQVSEISTNLIIGSSNFGNIDTKKAEYLISGGITGYGKGTSIIGCYNVGTLDTHERTCGSIAGVNTYSQIRGTFWLAGTCLRGIGLGGEEFSSIYEKNESELKNQMIVDELNSAIRNWNEQNPDKAYPIEYHSVVNDYPRISKN